MSFESGPICGYRVGLVNIAEIPLRYLGIDSAHVAAHLVWRVEFLSFFDFDRQREELRVLRHKALVVEPNIGQVSGPSSIDPNLEGFCLGLLTWQRVDKNAVIYGQRVKNNKFLMNVPTMSLDLVPGLRVISDVCDLTGGVKPRALRLKKQTVHHHARVLGRKVHVLNTARVSDEIRNAAFDLPPVQELMVAIRVSALQPLSARVEIIDERDADGRVQALDGL